jgi:hypothetical protein
LSHLAAILTLLAALAACVGYGYLWLRLLKLWERSPETRDSLQLLYAAALGMGTLGYLVLALGLSGFLSRFSLGALVVIGWLPASRCLWQYRPFLRSLIPTFPRPPAARVPDASTLHAPTILALLCTAFLGLLALLTLASALRPVDGLDWDGLSYHLAAPKIYLREGRIPFIAYDPHTHFPFTMEMLYTLGLAFGGGSGAKLFHWAAGWLTALAVGIWTSRLEIGGRRPPEWACPAAAAAFASMPVVLWEMGTAYVELGTALFQFLALAAVLDAVRVRAGTLSVAGGRVALAGVLSGFALGTKYTALLQFGLIGLGLLWVVLRACGSERKTALRAFAGFGVLGVLIASPWYLKNWLWVQNPVYPFFYNLFPNSYSWTQQAADAYSLEQETFGLGQGPNEMAKALWNLAVHGRAFYINERSLAGDKLGSLGPVWIGLLPLVLWSRWLGWRVWALVLYSGASLGVWFFMSQQVRYLVPVFAPLAVVAAAIVAALASRPLRIAAGGFLALALVLNLAMHAPLGIDSVTLLSGQVSEREYLRASLPGLYEAAEFVNRLPVDTRVALYQETRGFYLDRDYFWANPLHHNLIPYDRLQNGDELVTDLRRFGITHILINYQFTRGVAGTRWYELLEDAILKGRLKEVFRSRDHPPRAPPVVIYELP